MSQGQVALRAMAQMDENGKKKSKAKCYDPKVAEFQAYCDTFFAMLPPDRIYQVTKTKVEAYLTYCFYREQKQKGRWKKGTNPISIDWTKANAVLKMYQGGASNHRTNDLFLLKPPLVR